MYKVFSMFSMSGKEQRNKMIEVTYYDSSKA